MKEDKKKKRKKKKIVGNVSRCPQCSRHCPSDALRCRKGRDYFERL